MVGYYGTTKIFLKTLYKVLSIEPWSSKIYLHFNVDMSLHMEYNLHCQWLDVYGYLLTAALLKYYILTQL